MEENFVRKAQNGKEGWRGEKKNESFFLDRGRNLIIRRKRNGGGGAGCTQNYLGASGKEVKCADLKEFC